MKTPALTLSIVTTVGLGLGGGWQMMARGNPQSGAAEKSAPQAAPGGQGAGTADTAKAALPPGDSAEFAAIIRTLFRDPLRERRLLQLRGLLAKFKPEHFAAMIHLVRENDLRGSDTGEEWTVLWTEWGHQDGPGALKKIREFDWKAPGNAAPAEAQYRAVTGWASVDPAAAKQYVETTKDTIYSLHPLSKSLVKGWSVTDPRAAGAWLAQKGSGSREEYFVVVDAIFRRDGAAALDKWLDTMSRSHPPAALTGFAEPAAGLKRRINPEAGAAWIELHRNDKWIVDSPVIANAAAEYAFRDPAGAMEWAGRTGLPRAASVVMDNWCQRDVSAASGWLKSHRESPAYSTAVSELVKHIRQENPKAARTWAETIPDAAIKAETLKGIPPNP